MLPLEQGELQQLGDCYQVTWPVTGVQIAFDRLAEMRDGLFAETTIAQLTPRQAPRLLHDARLNLLSVQTKAAVVRTLEKQREDVDWTNVLETACYLVKRKFRDGDPAVDLATVAADARPRWVIRPYLSADRPAVLFGAGGAGKTMLALAMAVGAACGRALVGQPVGPPRRVLVLDYESDQYVHRERVTAICAGANLEPLAAGRLFHRRMASPLAAVASSLRAEIARLDVDLVLVDSLAQASGELEESGPIVQCFGAVRSFGVPTLIISHVTKATVEGDEAPVRRRLMPFGSVFTTNSAGNTWSLRRRGEEGCDDYSLSLVHEKTNNGRYQPRHAYRVAFTQGAQEDDPLVSVHYQREDYAEAFADSLPLAARILAYLGREGAATPEAVSDALGVERSQVAPQMSRLKGAGRLVLLQGGRGYGLAAIGGQQ